MMFEILSLFIAVVLGIGMVLLIKPKHNVINYLLTFSGAYLLSITMLHLLPEVFRGTDKLLGLFVLIGLIFQLILDFFSKGVDHGHVHHQEVKVFPWALFISLNIHSFMEGLAVVDHHHEHLLWAIIIHKIPIAMVLATFLLDSKLKKYLAVVFLIIFGLMSPLGVLLGNKISFLIDYQQYINAFIAGMFLHISTTILSESTDNHKFNWLKFIMLFLGVLVALLV